jgi:hypothetical protein
MKITGPVLQPASGGSSSFERKEAAAATIKRSFAVYPALIVMDGFLFPPLGSFLSF